VSAEVLGRSLGYGQAGSTGGSRRQRRGASGLGPYVEHVDDGSTTGRDQVRHSQAGAANRGKDLEVEVGGPVVVGDLIDPPCGALARVVHQAVQAAPPGDGRIDEPFEVSQPGDIGLHHNCITSGVPQTLLGGGQPVGVPPAYRDPGPFLDEPIGKRRSQPVAPACDEHDLAIQVQIH
jgi:hypothetical protein